jgi:hypothetical protein
MSQHDVWLARYQTGTEVVWCANRACSVHQDGMEVRWESEYGQSWWSPEECPVCHGGWLQDKPELEEGDDEIG